MMPTKTEKVVKAASKKIPVAKFEIGGFKCFLHTKIVSIVNIGDSWTFLCILFSLVISMDFEA